MIAVASLALSIFPAPSAEFLRVPLGRSRGRVLSFETIACIYVYIYLYMLDGVYIHVC